jgi:hypothetical protein
MAIKVARSPVTEVAAYFTLVLDIETVQLVEPIRDRLAVPAKRHIFGIIDGRITVNFLPLGIALRVYRLLL